MTASLQQPPVTSGRPSPRRFRSLRTAATVVELALATVAVVLDLLIPALVILLVAGVSLVVRREGGASLGFHRPAHPGRLAGRVLLLAAGWTLVQVGLVMPVLNHVTGDRQDLSAFEDLQGKVGLLVVLVVASWVLGALAEETAFRGYLQTRVVELVGGHRAGILVAVGLTSVLFGLIHTEQGAIGVVLTTLDALFFSWLRWRNGTVWAAVLGHGFNNTIGLVTFFLVGPVHGLW